MGEKCICNLHSPPAPTPQFNQYIFSLAGDKNFLPLRACSYASQAAGLGACVLPPDTLPLQRSAETSPSPNLCLVSSLLLRVVNACAAVIRCQSCDGDFVASWRG